MTDHEESQLKAAYQEHLFGSESALLFAEHLLTKLNHFGDVEQSDPETGIRKNIAQEILSMCDRWEGVDVQAYLQNLPIAVKEKEDD